MRVLMISDVYFPRINGVSTSIQTFRRDLAALGQQVDLLAPAYPARADADQEDILRIPSRYLFFDPEDRMMSARAIRKKIPELRRRRYDLVHIQTPFVAHYLGLRIARELGVPVVETYHTYFEEYLYHYLPWLPASWLRGAARRFTRSQCNQVDAVVVPSTRSLTHWPPMAWRPRCKSFPPASTSIASRLAMAQDSVARLGFLRTVRSWYTWVGSPTKRTSTSCCRSCTGYARRSPMCS
jgi:glycosyltransferase involved in cell wall biosynthesis